MNDQCVAIPIPGCVILEDFVVRCDGICNCVGFRDVVGFPLVFGSALCPVGFAQFADFAVWVFWEVCVIIVFTLW